MILKVNDRPVPQPYASIAAVLLIPAGLVILAAFCIVICLALPGILVMVVGDARR